MSSQVVPVAAPVLTGGFGSVQPAAGRAIVEREEGFSVTVSPNPMDRQFDFWTSLSGEHPSHREVILKAMSNTVQKGSEMLGKPFEVCDAVCHPVELENEKTGEVTQEIRMVLIGPSGSMVGFVSRGAFKSLGLVCRLYGPLPWLPPKTISVTQYSTRKGYRSYELSVVSEREVKPNPGRRKD